MSRKLLKNFCGFHEVWVDNGHYRWCESDNLGYCNKCRYSCQEEYSEDRKFSLKPYSDSLCITTQGIYTDDVVESYILDYSAIGNEVTLTIRCENDSFSTEEDMKKHIKEISDKYKDIIPQKLYDAMLSFDISIND